MSGGAGTYTIHNTQNADATFLNSDGNLVTILPGNTGVFTITAAVWSSLVALLGSSNVTQQVSNPTFRYAASAFSMVATPTDVIVIQGSATKTINITKIRLAGAIGAGTMPFTIVRRSTAGTLSPAVLTAVAAAFVDTNQATATATVSTVGTGNYGTLGTQNPTGGVIDSGRLVFLAAAAAGGDSEAVKLTYGVSNDQPLKLRGTSDFICINFGGAAIPASGVLDFSIETFEDNS